ncbi:MAG: sulfurtransferase TusA family protein [Acidobacteria bacterium]|nr:sulfurtransferase TusA family protein [Acidobacteriota bacterium]
MAMRFQKKGAGVYTLDVQGYVCPHPQLYTKKAIEKLKEGDVLELIFDNPSSAETISAMCDKIGMELIHTTLNGGKYIWQIRKIRA